MLGDDALVGGVTGGRLPRPEVVGFTADDHDGLTGRLVEAVGRGSRDFRHGAALLVDRASSSIHGWIE